MKSLRSLNNMKQVAQTMKRFSGYKEREHIFTKRRVLEPRQLINAINRADNALYEAKEPANKSLRFMQEPAVRKFQAQSAANGHSP